MAISDPSPTSVVPTDSNPKIDARQKAQEVRLLRRQLRYERSQARRWKALHQRPGSVLAVSLTLTLLGLLMVVAAPFIAIQEEIYGYLPVLERSVLVPALIFGVLMVPLGYFLGQARGWARIGVVLVGGGLVAFVAYPVPTLLTAVPLALVLLCLVLLFNPAANRFFR